MPPAFAKYVTSSLAYRGESMRMFSARARDEVGVRTEGRTGVEPASPHSVGDRFRKNSGLRAGLLRFAAYRCSRTNEHGAPSSKSVLWRLGLPREHALAVSPGDKPRCDMACRAAVNALIVDVPVAGSRIRIADACHSC